MSQITKMRVKVIRGSEKPESLGVYCQNNWGTSIVRTIGEPVVTADNHSDSSNKCNGHIVHWRKSEELC